MKHKPTEPKEYDAASPEDPFVLLRPPLNHAYRVSADAQGRPDAVELLLRAPENLVLMTEIAKHGSASFEVLV